MALGGAVVGRIRRLGALGALTFFAAACGGSDTAITGISDAVASVTILVEDDTGVPSAEQAIALEVGESAELSATATNALGLAVTDVNAAWSSSAPGVVQVGGDGVATALSAGQADLYAAVGEVAATIRVVVTEPTTVPPPSP